MSPEGSSEGKETRVHIYLILLITMGAFIVRVWGLNWGLPEIYEEATPMHKAFSFWGKDTGRFDFNPHFFNYPAFYFYIQFAVQGLYFLFGRMIGLFSSLTAFRLHFNQGISTFVLLGRLTTTLFGVFTVLFTYLLAKRFFNERVGIVASFFLAFNLIHVVNSQSISVDVPLTLFVVLSLFFIHSVYERAGFRDYALAGLCIGLGMGIKYTAALLVIPLLVAHFLRKQRSSSIQKRIIDSKIAIGVTTVVFSFILVSPFCLLDFQSFWKDFSIEMRHMAEGHFGQEETATPYLSYLTGPLKKGSGIPVEILALVGLIISLIRRGHNELLFLSFPIVYYAVVGRWSVQTDRYILPVIPFLLILAAYSLFFIFERISFLRPKQSILISIFAFGLIIPSTLGIIDHRTAQSRPDTRTLAKEWIEKNIPQGSIVVLESQTPPVNENHYTCVHIPIYTVTPELTAPFYDLRWYGGSHYIILSSYVYGRYQREQKKYPKQNQFYTTLDASFVLMKRFDSTGGRGPVIKIYRNQNIGHEISSDITHPLKNLLETPSLTLERKADFLAKLGSAYLQAKMSAKAALILLRTASLLQPQNPELHCYLASAYFLDGQTDQSIGQCDMALQLDPNFPKAHFIRAIVLDETGRIEEAISAYQKYLSLKPEDIVAYIRIGLAYEKIDKVDEAKNVWRKILQIDPQNTVALNNMRRLEDSSP